MVAPAVEKARHDDPGLIRNMEPEDLRGQYLRFIGAGAVAAGGIISMFRALPLIVGLDHLGPVAISAPPGGPPRPVRQRPSPAPSATCR